MSISALSNLPGYEITEQLYTGTRTLVYRGIRISDRQSVIIKILRSSHPNFNELVQFRNQYTIAKNLDLPNIIKTFTLEVYGNSYALVMENFGGISLFDYLSFTADSLKCSYLPLLEFLEIAIQLTEVLQYLYQNRVIHKDIKPANILINPHTKQVKLIDFSIASLLPRETEEIQNANALEGTLAYLSPEQTGRMNRGIDYRSDFYSLGVTFYELLTGVLPFSAEEPMELVHCHLAKQPIRIDEINREIPLVLSEIVSKLMAKNAEERYQSAWGIKHDLDICLAQLQTTGVIEPFEIAKRDISDRFLIPEKLYGRETEVNQLLTAFDRVANGTTEMMLVAGFSGVGKTAAINEVHKPIVRQRGYFIKGKYEQFQRNIPLKAFVQAFRDLIGQLLSESEQQLQTWKTQILTAVGDNGQVLIDVIPELENIIGKQPPVLELSGTAAQNRFNLLFPKFVQVFTSKKHPLVMFLDDLQWADSASLNLLKLLMQDAGYLLILGAYRDNEVFPLHPFILTVDEIVKTGATVNTITLPPLKESDMNCLIADTLNCELSLAQDLTKLIYQKTQGNPFFATQFLKALHDEKLITFNWEIQHWQCDISQVKALAITDDVVEFMAWQLQKLPRETQDILKLAACMGAQFDLHTLAIVSQQSETETAARLWRALQEGLILPMSKIYKFYQLEVDDNLNSENEKVNQENPRYRFLHDRVQQAAYSLIPEDRKQITHWKIGQLLLQGLSHQQQIEEIFNLVNQLNLGRFVISSQEQKQQLAQLNLQAGQKAKISAAYQAAQNYCAIGIDLLPKEAWQTDYQLVYKLYCNGSEAAYLCGNFEQAEVLYATAIVQAQTSLDKAVIYRIQMTQYQLQGRNAEAIAIQRQSLKLLGWTVPETPENIQSSLDEQIKTVNKFLEQQRIESILELPKMEDAIIAEMLRILQILFYAAWLNGESTLALLALAKMTTLSLEYGNSDMSPFGYVGYGLIVNALLKKAALAYQFGNMAVQLCEQFDNADVRGMTNFLFAADVHSWSRPLREADTYYENAFKYGMEAGNWLTVSFMMMQSGSDRLTYGKQLDELYAIAKIHADFLHQIKSLENLDALIVGVLQPIRHLLGLTKTILSFDDDSFSETEFLQKYCHNPYHLAWLYSVKIRHAYLFDQPATYPDLIPQLSIIENTISSHAKVPSSVFYVALMHVVLIEISSDKLTRESHWQALASLEEKLEQWQKNCPANIGHKYLLLQAEKARIDGRKAEAIDFYEQAIAQAKTQNYIYEEAIANELAAKFYLSWGKEKIASGYMQEAYYCYARWGTRAKIADLEQHYPELLGAILQPINLAIKSGATLSGTLSRTSNSTSHNQNVWLDFPVVMKAAQAISEEIELEKLLTTLMQIVLASAGAQTGFLVIDRQTEWVVVARANQNHTENLQIPLAECQELPQSLIYSVIRSQTTAVFDNLSLSEQLMSDRYIITHQPKSALCIPISKQGKLIAILYLENNLTEGAFTSDRIETLQLLTSQAAISIENARLYQQVENYSHTLEAEVARKTEELSQKATDLEQTLQNLQQTQAQLIQSEKMSALGQLVAGIAHEINNPVTFIHGNLPHIENYLKNLLSLLEIYQQEYPQDNSVIKAKIEEIDLDFIWKDAIKILQSMKVGSERIEQIILSLQNFSRLNESQTKSVDLHKGIDSTLLILQSRFQNSDDRPKIQVIKEYGNLPLVACYASEMNQVFLNIISNAIDALEEVSKTNKNPSIKIQTEVREKEWVRIAIADNGNGIPAHIQKRIFEPFFTTKPVGSGTGLGLSVSYAIVKKHGGQLICDSPVGRGAKFVIEIPINYPR
ncbi:AAA family ATPase [Floridanema evergladense]|uniref:histidine kinase n=1 Tax=Floridaenema evergladense BLCC-F167 TaxID=3153639 RepID=A0ABV4WIK7_9CYAN